MRRHDHRTKGAEPGMHLLDRGSPDSTRCERIGETTKHDIERFTGHPEFAVRVPHASARIVLRASQGDGKVGAKVLLQRDGVGFREPFRGHVVSQNTIVEVGHNARNRILAAEQVVQTHLFPL